MISKSAYDRRLRKYKTDTFILTRYTQYQLHRHFSAVQKQLQTETTYNSADICFHASFEESNIMGNREG